MKYLESLRNCFLLSSLLSLSQFLSAQHYEVMFNNIFFDYGVVEEWNDEPAVFYITNVGHFTLQLQPSDELDPKLTIELSPDPLEPGKTTKALVYYHPTDPGTFHIPVLIDLKTKDDPIELFVKGEVLSLKKEEIEYDITFNQEEISRDQYAPNNVVLLIDVSSSMRLESKLPTLKEASKQMLGALRDIDYLTVISYSTKIKTVVARTAISNKGAIALSIDSLLAVGRSRGAGALFQAYYVLEKDRLATGNNQVILATDGVFNDKDLSTKGLFKLVEAKAKKGISLTVLGFGNDEEAQKFMKKLAKSGNGNYYHIDPGKDLEETLIEEIKAQSQFTDQ